MKKEIEQILVEWKGKTISSNEHFQKELRETLEQFAETIKNKLCRKFDKLELEDKDDSMVN